MSLFKQMTILISVIFIILFTLIVSISFNQIKDSAKESLYKNIQNSASNISLSITNANADISAIKTVINASFDNGNYEKIVFKDLENKIIYERVKKEEQFEENLPIWFIKFVNIDEVSVLATVSQTWKVLGTIEIFADRDIFYIQLYKMFISLIITLTITFLTFLILVFIFLKSMLKPLEIIKKQSEAIIDNTFIFSEKLPFTSEFKSLTININSMLKKIQEIFNHANDILKRNKELLYVDELTGLYNRKYLVMKISEFLEENSINHSGYIVCIDLIRVDLLNKIFGYKKVDNLIIQIVKEIKELFLRYESSIIVRSKAAEFIVILPRIKEREAKNVSEQISSKLKELLSFVEDDEIDFFIGLCNFKNEKIYSDILSKIDYTLCQTKIQDNNYNGYYYLKKDIVHNTRDDWRNIINNAINNDYFYLVFKDIVSLNSSKIVYKSISFGIKTYDKDFSYSEFIASAIELKLLEKIYLKIIEKLLCLDKYNKRVTIQIPNKFVEHLPFEKLMELFERKNNFVDIVFELEEEVFFKYKYNCLTFIDLLRDNGFGIAVFNFMAISDDYTYLKEQKPEFIKLNRYFLETSENLDVLKIIKESLDIEVIATSIDDDKDLDFINKKGIKLITGIVTEKLLKDSSKNT